ncbi:TonB-dependent receptor family protein [Methylobacterium sp. P31]
MLPRLRPVRHPVRRLLVALLALYALALQSILGGMALAAAGAPEHVLCLGVSLDGSAPDDKTRPVHDHRICCAVCHVVSPVALPAPAPATATPAPYPVVASRVWPKCIALPRAPPEAAREHGHHRASDRSLPLPDRQTRTRPHALPFPGRPPRQPVSPCLRNARCGAGPDAPGATVTLPELSVVGSATPSGPLPGEARGSLSVPSVDAERAALYGTVGSVAFVDAATIQDRYANTLRDVLKDVPGVYVQERYGQELRLSVRGSGVARAYHLRGIELLQDGIPFNLADGSGDFYQIDPLALRTVEVYKGGNALAFGATTLGGAVNFVTPTAYTALAPNILRIDGGSFGTIREQAQMSRIDGPLDVLIDATLTDADGFRAHEAQATKNFNANIGYRIAPDIETRFYLGTYLTDQKLPGTLTLGQSLTTPTLANPTAITGNQSRKVETERIANRTSFLLDVGKLDVDTWAIHKSLYHPIFQAIDQDGWTYGISPHWAGTFDLGDFRNDVVLGLRAFAGQNSALQFVNIRGQRGAPTLNSLQSASSYEAYGENRFWFLPNVALMTGAKAFSSNRTFSDKGAARGPASALRRCDLRGHQPEIRPALAAAAGSAGLRRRDPVAGRA